MFIQYFKDYCKNTCSIFPLSINNFVLLYFIFLSVEIFTFALRVDVVITLLFLFVVVADDGKCVIGDGNVNFVECE